MRPAAQAGGQACCFVVGLQFWTDRAGAGGVSTLVSAVTPDFSFQINAEPPAWLFDGLRHRPISPGSRPGLFADLMIQRCMPFYHP